MNSTSNIKRKSNRDEEYSDIDVIPATPIPNRKKYKPARDTLKTISRRTEAIQTLEVNNKINSMTPVAEANGEDEASGIADDEMEGLFMNIDFSEEFTKHEASDVKQLDLSSWKRCIVISVERDLRTFDVILKVNKENDENSSCICRLQGPWTSSRVSSLDLVSIIGRWNDSYQAYCVSSDVGFIIVCPDHLVSGTSVVGSLFCRRKGVLSERFTGIDFNNHIMVIGSMVHELFQTVIGHGLRTTAEVQGVCEQLINSPGMASTLYDIQMSVAHMRKELTSFVPKIVRFIEQYITGDNVKFDKDMFMDKIEKINDIEENIWVPQLGLKGKVDVSVKIRRRNHFADADVELMPLEIKTGKASFSSEHRGQVIIYQMMMSEVGQKVDTGLLLYLREGIIKEVKVTRHEQRDLIMLRNEVAFYMANSGQPLEVRDTFRLYKEKMSTFGVPTLPEPINHHSACGNCPYQVICCAYLSRESDVQLSEKHPLNAVRRQVIDNILPASHVDYFIHWTGLLALEEQQSKNENELKSIWTDPPLKRQKRRKAIVGLRICEKVQEVGTSFLHMFTPGFRYSGAGTQSIDADVADLTLCGMVVGDYLRVSSDSRIAIAAGRVLAITPTTITINLERDLSKRYRNVLFILDKNDSQSGVRFNLANLGALLDNTITSNQLRKIIVDREPPTSSKTLPKIVSREGKVVLLRLNRIQQTAVLRALTANEYMLLKGLPGTGKTETLVAIIQLLRIMGKTILITSHTHSAVDNVLVRLLKENLTFLRIGDPSRVVEAVRPFCECNLIQHCKSPEDMDAVYNEFPIVGVTCLGAGHAVLRHRTFDVCLVDESTQVLQATVLRPLLSARKFILVGDPDQLPPIVRSKEAKSMGADESLFKRLDSEAATVTLTLQYRMNKTITKIANDVTYKGSLKCGNDAVSTATLNIPRQSVINQHFAAEKWLQRCVSSHLDNAVMLLNTSNVFERSTSLACSLQADQPIELADKISRIYSNYCEASVVLHIITALLMAGVDGSAIGIIAPYTAQVELLKKLIHHKSSAHGIEVNTVDQYQGRDKQIIIYSCTKCDNPTLLNQQSTVVRETEILEDFRRLTVAITRAKHKLIILGDVSSLQAYTPFRRMFESLSGMAKIDLLDGQKGFRWDVVSEPMRQVFATG